MIAPVLLQGTPTSDVPPPHGQMPAAVKAEFEQVLRGLDGKAEPEADLMAEQDLTLPNPDTADDTSLTDQRANSDPKGSELAAIGDTDPKVDPSANVKPQQTVEPTTEPDLAAGKAPAGQPDPLGQKHMAHAASVAELSMKRSTAPAGSGEMRDPFLSPQQMVVTNPPGSVDATDRSGLASSLSFPPGMSAQSPTNAGRTPELSANAIPLGNGIPKATAGELLGSKTPVLPPYAGHQAGADRPANGQGGEWAGKPAMLAQTAGATDAPKANTAPHVPTLVPAANTQVVDDDAAPADRLGERAQTPHTDTALIRQSMPVLNALPQQPHGMQPVPVLSAPPMMVDQDTHALLTNLSLEEGVMPTRGGDAPSSAHTAASPLQAQAKPVVMQVVQFAPQVGQQAVEVTLSPEELGKVRMSLTTIEGALTLSITADRPDTLDLLRRHAGDLGEEFGALGYDSVDFQFHQDGTGADHDPPAQHGRDDTVKPTDPALVSDADTQVWTVTQTGLDLRF